MNSNENDKEWAEMRFNFDEYRKQLAEFGNEKEKLRDEIITDKDQLWDEMF